MPISCESPVLMPTSPSPLGQRPVMVTVPFEIQ
jgi:hypothetical protein